MDGPKGETCDVPRPCALSLLTCGLFWANNAIRRDEDSKFFNGFCFKRLVFVARKLDHECGGSSALQRQ